MKTKIAILSLAVVAVSMPALANEMNAEEKARHFLEKADSNNDNQISKTEHDTFATTMFNEADTDDDNMLSLAEMTAYKQKEKDEMNNSGAAHTNQQ